MKKTLLIMLGLAALLSGCEKIPNYFQGKVANSKKEEAKSQTGAKQDKDKKKKTSNVGISNVIDYGTGYTPLKIKQKKEESLNQMNKDRNDNLQKALKN
jgi:flagellar biosynthesis component FlhA